MKPCSIALACLLLGIVPAPVTAQSSVAEADALFDEGKALMAAGKIAEGCAALEKSQKLAPSVSTLLNLANCREKNGQLATAWRLFAKAERETKAATDDLSVQMHPIAVDRVSRLEPRLSKLTINVDVASWPGQSPIVGLQILRAGVVLDVGAWNKTLPIDGGTYPIVARAPGRVEWTTTVTIKPEGDIQTVDVPKLTDATTLTNAATLTTAPVSVEAESLAMDAAPPRQRSKVVPLVVGGAAVAVLGIALGVELSARSTYDESKLEPDDSKQESSWRSANTRRHIAQGLAGAGVACAGVAVWLYLRGGRDEASAPVARIGRVRVEPIVTGDRAGLQLLGRW